MLILFPFFKHKSSQTVIIIGSSNPEINPVLFEGDMVKFNSYVVEL